MTLPYTSEEIAALLAFIGVQDNLETTSKVSLVDAINELFTSASEGKSAIAAALTGKGVETASTATFAAMAAAIDGMIGRMVKNDGEIVPTGTYATSVYYNVEFGVLVSYAANGDVVLTMKGGTTTAYEDLNFVIASAPDGVTMDFVLNTGTSSTAAKLYSCVLHGITKPVNISIVMDAYNASYDWTQCSLTITEV